ncbi:S1C family serine protease [Micromonospora coerulea]|uniref:S1C family serine protease n=1 Tax=Micromonospora coerulea TaxID=47856 RepID=UPI0019037827|nr:S1C family serine protease [Micromonospora veneta]
MTAGYGSGEPTPGRRADEAAEGDRTDRTETGRPGPLPPRFAPHPPVPTTPSATGHPAAPAAGFGPLAPAPEAATTDAGQAAVPGPRTSWSGPPNTGQWGSPTGPGSGAPATARGWTPAQPAAGQPYGAEPPFPGAPAGQPIAGPGHPAGPQLSAPTHPAGQPGPAPTYPGGQPVSAPAYPGGPPVSGPAYPGGSPVSGPAYPGGPAGWPAAAAGPDRRRRLPVVAAVGLAVVLAVVAGVQAYQIQRLDDRLAATDRRLADAQRADGTRLDDLDQRAEAIEKQVGAAFNPEAVASAVLPSVFRVRAGQFTGTAFAIGKPPAGGGTTLLTNFHVVEAVFDGGGRKVFLERTDQRFEATIVKVDKAKDIAQLRTTAKFTGLVAAGTPVKSGQQIVVVGAPLGLQDSVTTGVVSAFRKDEDGSGPVIQFDAPINPGNSGGPVINGSKEVVGIATAKARDAEGIGLAVPIKTACDTFKLC